MNHQQRENKAADRAAESNSIIKQMANHGREVNSKWPEIRKALDKEDEASTAPNPQGQATDRLTRSTSRKRSYQQQAEESAKRMRNNLSEEWDGWL